MNCPASNATNRKSLLAELYIVNVVVKVGIDLLIPCYAMLFTLSSRNLGCCLLYTCKLSGYIQLPLARAHDFGCRVNLEATAMRPMIDLSSLTSLWNGVEEGTT